jgi:hypothetical protein
MTVVCVNKNVQDQASSLLRNAADARSTLSGFLSVSIGR